MPFDGKTYNRQFDFFRLNTQLSRVLDLMIDGKWRTLREIANEIESPEASISARLRDLRKRKFGEFYVNRRRRGDDKAGLFEYSVHRE